jgi:hypothetical protein
VGVFLRTAQTFFVPKSVYEYTVDILLFFSPKTGESAQLRFAHKNFGRISSDLGEFRPFCSRRICCFGEISPKSKEIRPKFWERNLTAPIRPFRARKNNYCVCAFVKQLSKIKKKNQKSSLVNYHPQWLNIIYSG